MKKTVNNFKVFRMCIESQNTIKGGAGNSKYPPTLPEQAGHVILPMLPDMPELPDVVPAA